jgi:hypothetical protein
MRRRALIMITSFVRSGVRQAMFLPLMLPLRISPIVHLMTDATLCVRCEDHQGMLGTNMSCAVAFCVTEH